MDITKDMADVAAELLEKFVEAVERTEGWVNPVLWKPFSYLADEARTLLAEREQTAPSVPEGWQLVPKEPTQEMIRAGSKRTNYGIPMDIYRSMIDAAPKPEGE